MTNSITEENKFICFHDGDCPICRIEINTMKKLDRAKKVKWIDISKEKQYLTAAGLNYDEAMSKMYVIDQNEGLKSGVDAFLLLWSQLPYYRKLAVFVKKIPFCKPILGLFYKIFAKYRLKLTRR